MNSFKDLIAAWRPTGPKSRVATTGVAALAADIGLSYHKVYAWFRRDSIPQTYWAAVASAGRKRGINVTTDLLLHLAAQRGREAA